MKTSLKYAAVFLIALSVIMPAMATAQSSADVWLAYADRYYSEKNYEKALEGYDRALALEPDNYTAMLRKGLCYYQLGDMTQAILLLEKANAQRPSPKVTSFIAGLKKRKSSEHNPGSPVSGGAARVFALAGTSPQLYDPNYDLDMYSERFPSSYVFRKPANYAALSPGISFAEERVINTGTSYSYDSHITPFAGEYGASNCGAAYWFAPWSALVIAPYYSRASGEQARSYYYGLPGAAAVTNTVIDTYFSLDARYAHKIGNSLSLGIMAQYFSRNWFDTHEDTGDGNTMTDEVNLRRISYLLSATWAIESGTDTIWLCAAAGSLRPHDYREGVSGEGSGVQMVPEDGTGYTQELATISPSTTVNMDQEYSVTVYDAWIGAGYSNPGLIDITSKIFCSPYIAARNRVKSTLYLAIPGTTTTLDDYDHLVTDDLKTFGFDASTRIYLPWLTAGAGITTDYTYGTMHEMPGNTANASNTRLEWYAGAAVKAWDKFMIPVEFYYVSAYRKDTREAYIELHYYETFGYKAGVEYRPDANLSLRAGVKYLFGGYVNNIGPSGSSDMLKITYGTSDNPSYSLTGMYAGAGYLLGSWEFNLSAGFDRRNTSPLPENNTLYTSGKTTLVLDVKYLF